MTKARVAKNLLAGMSCNTCFYCDKRNKRKPLCHWHDHISEGKATIPQDKTCDKWTEIVGIMMQTFPIKTRARKLKIKWTQIHEDVKRPSRKKSSRR